MLLILDVILTVFIDEEVDDSIGDPQHRCRHSSEQTHHAFLYDRTMLYFFHHLPHNLQNTVRVVVEIAVMQRLHHYPRPHHPDRIG